MYNAIVKNELYIRNIVFGVVDSLVSTVALLSGVDIGGASRGTIILTGAVYTLVEAFSMAAGSFLSEETAEEAYSDSEISDKMPFLGGLMMFISFVAASFVPILPYIFINLSAALPISILLSLLLLFILGFASARFSKIHKLKHALRMALLGGGAIIIGVLVGKFVKIK